MRTGILVLDKGPWATRRTPMPAFQALGSIGCRYCQTYYRAFAGHTLARAGDLAGALARLDDSLSLVAAGRAPA